MLKRFFKRPELLFLILGLFWGLIFLFINPPFQAPDEDDHLFKMWSIIEGSSNFKVLNNTKGQILPNSYIIIAEKFQKMKFDFDKKTTANDIISLKNIKLDKNAQSFYAQTPTAYTILSYIPAIFVLFILKLLNVPPIYMLYILRFCCLLTYLAIMYQAIKIMPCKKWLFFILALLPNNLYIASAISPDCLVISSAFLLIAYTFKLKLDNNVKQITNKDIFKWGLLFAFLCILKYIYFPFILLFFLLPKEKFASFKSHIKPFVSIAAISFLYIAVFLIITVIMTSLGTDKYHKDSLSTIIMIRHIVTHPIQYITGIIITTFLASFSYVISLISHFGWEPFSINNFGIISFYIIIFIMLLYKDSEEKSLDITIQEKLILFMCITVCYILILTSVSIIYRQFPLVVGFQGRYASPYAPLIFMLFATNKVSLKNEAIPIAANVFLQVLYIQCVFTIIGRFFY